MADSSHLIEPEECTSYDDASNTAMLRLKEYIAIYKHGIILAGPPSLQGSLAHFYKQHPTEGSIIKAYEYKQHKAGIHSFVQKYPDVFSFHGKSTQKHVVLVESMTRPKTSQQYREPQIAECRRTERLNHRINELRGTIKDIKILIKELSDQVEKLSN